MYKVFIGTLYCKEESGLEECIQSIQKQKNITYLHKIVSNLPEREAHQERLNCWLQIKNSMDYYVRIGPDFVLNDENLLFDVCQRMQKENIDFLQYGLHDFLSDSQIFGLNTFSKNVEFSEPPSLSCDKNFVRKNYNCVYDKTVVGTHMVHCNSLQAFHYGVHRGLKDQIDLLNKVKRAHEKFGDIRRLYAIKGFENANLFNKEKHNFDYQSQDLLNKFAKIKSQLEK